MGGGCPQAPTGRQCGRPASGGGTKPRHRPARSSLAPARATLSPAARKGHLTPQTSSTPSPPGNSLFSHLYVLSRWAAAPLLQSLEVYSMACAMVATQAISMLLQVLLLTPLARPEWLQARLWVLKNGEPRANAVTHTQSTTTNCPAHGMHAALSWAFPLDLSRSF